VNCPVDVCARRDPKGLYSRAAKGEIDSLIGFNTPYLSPEDPDIVVDTATLTLDQGVDLLEASILTRIGTLTRTNGNRTPTYGPGLY
jgi:adenylylsulfate kinase-like enzyme